ncbi:MAG: glutathione binding-like protein [Sedimentitalea sp.]|uniref:glutathione binding-like protein n=1 Tax=Sedimentitalea sp. TaxID=2048915 RepID=UPI003267F419
METYQCAEWESKQKEAAAATMAYLVGVLADNDYVAGGRFSAADITTFAGLAFADLAKVEIPQSHENLQAWHSRLANRPPISG